MFNQAVPALGLSLERGTANVPDDGRFHLLVRGQVQESFGNKNAALARYREMRDELLAQTDAPVGEPAPTREEQLEKLRSESEINAVLARARADKRANATKRGGGGRRT